MVLLEERGRSIRVRGLDEFDHRQDSDEDEPRDDMDTTVIQVDQPEVPTVTDLASPVAKGPYSGFKSPPQTIIIERKGKKRSRDLSVIPKSILVEAGTTFLSSTFETAEEDQEEDESRLRPH